MDFAQVQLVKFLMIVAAFIGLLVAFTLYIDGYWDKEDTYDPFASYSEGFNVDESNYNAHTDVASVYLQNADGSDSVCVDSIGVYTVPEDPVLKVVVKDGYSVGKFGDRVLIYTKAGEYSYHISVVQGATMGETEINGNEIIMPFEVDDGQDSVGFKFTAVLTDLFCELELGYGNPIYTWLDTANYPPTLETVVTGEAQFGYTVIVPEGKTITKWTYDCNGTTVTLTAGDTEAKVMLGAVLTAVWEDVVQTA